MVVQALRLSIFNLSPTQNTCLFTVTTDSDGVGSLTRMVRKLLFKFQVAPRLRAESASGCRGLGAPTALAFMIIWLRHTRSESFTSPSRST